MLILLFQLYLGLVYFSNASPYERAFILIEQNWKGCSSEDLLSCVGKVNGLGEALLILCDSTVLFGFQFSPFALARC